MLDERGKMMNNEALAQFLQARANASEKMIVFLVGGAFGVNDALKQRANFTWSLSPLVFPHQLMRLMLAEQLYQACTILKNEISPYINISKYLFLLPFIDKNTSYVLRIINFTRCIFDSIFFYIIIYPLPYLKSTMPAKLRL